jgi:hypothetical protein
MLRFLHPKKRIEVPNSTPDFLRANLSWKGREKLHQVISSRFSNTCLQVSLTKQTCKKPLKGASPVPGPIMIIGVDGSAGNLKFDCLTKIGAQLHSSLYSNGIVFCQASDHTTINQTVGILCYYRQCKGVIVPEGECYKQPTFIHVEQTPWWILPVGEGP